MDQRPGELGAPGGEADAGAPERIRDDIEHTRADMGETIDAIQERLSPQHVAEQVKETVRDATIGRAETMIHDASDTVKETGTSILDTIKSNPVPSAMVGIGLAWLMMGRSNGGGQRPNRYNPGATYRYQQRGYERYPQQSQREVGEMAGEMQQRAGDMVEQTRDKAGELADRTREQAEHLRDQAQEQVQRAGETFQETLDENPLAVGAVALALGAAVGLALPHTQTEDDWMGGARDSLVEQAQSAAQETIDRVEHVAREAGDAARDAAQQDAKRQGLSGR